jgi:hypothetical protein
MLFGYEKTASSTKVFLLTLLCLALCSLPAPANDEKWQTKSLSFETLGSDVNNYYHVVGLPKNCICQFMAAQPAYSEQGHDFFYVSGHPKMFIEVEYADDGQTIQRFRFIDKSPNHLSEKRFGGWQTKNVRQQASDFMDGISIVKLDMARDPFAMPFASMPFTPQSWKTDAQHRPWFLFDIAHDYPVIGMNHSQLVAILGTADYIPKASSDVHSSFNYVDRYVLSYGCLGVYSVLEIAYVGDRAVALRVVGPEKNQLVVDK